MSTVETPALPEYLPDDTIVLTDYAEIVEFLRHPKMRPEPAGENAKISAETLVTLYGQEHTRRRRAMNRLMRPDALEYYRQELLLPDLRERIAELVRSSGDGPYTTDLVSFTKSAFMRFAASMVGLRVEGPEAVERLMGLINDLKMAHRVKFVRGDHTAYLARGLAAKEEFRTEYYEPGRASCPVAHGVTDRHDLMSLMVQELDPSWTDGDLALREAITIIIGAVDTTASIIVHAVDELERWLKDHPERADDVTDIGFLSEVVQEVLRLHPVIPAFTRVAIEDVTLSTGRSIERGRWVAGVINAANQEPELFGDHSTAFDPGRRVVADRIPAYGLAFGTGPHQCIGLRLVLGNDGVGSAADLLAVLYEAGVRPDPRRPAQKESSYRDVFDEYGVEFTHPERVAR